jgi:hypothetical protein
MLNVSVLCFETEFRHSFIGEKGFFPDTKHSSQVYLASWLSDTPFYYDALEIIAERARRFWWGQQIDLATVSWSMLLAIEGRRRRIPQLSAYMALSHLVSLSFAQNLFFLALLLTPSPRPAREDELEPTTRLARLRNTLMPPKPTNWCPHPALFLGALILNFGAIFALPYAAGTKSFITTMVLSRAYTFLPLLIPKLVPVSWGTVHPHPHNAFSAFTSLFQVISVASFLLHAKASVVGLRYNTPDSHYHRHSRFIPWGVEERSTWERSTTALGKVLGSTADHPVVAAVGWDALICIVSLGLWAAVRATDVEGIIMSTIPFYGKHNLITSPTIKGSSTSLVKAEPEFAESPEPEAGMTLRRRGKPKARVGSIASSSGASEDAGTTTLRKRGRAKKNVPEEDKAYEPTPGEARDVVEGDILPPDDLDWESAALAWGLAAIGGLGTACAGVFGGECTSR